MFHDLLVLADFGLESLTLWREMMRRRTLRWMRPETEWLQGGRSARLVWPTAEWASFREFDFFFAHWHKAIDCVRDLKHDPRAVADPAMKLECLLFAWMDSNILTLEWPVPENAAGKLRRLQDWPTMCEILGSVFDDVHEKESVGHYHKSMYRVSDWFVKFAILLMPEIVGAHPGMRKKVGELLANEHMENIKKSWMKDEQAAQIRGMRCELLARLQANGLTGLADELREMGLPGMGKRHTPERRDVEAHAGELQRRATLSKRKPRKNSDWSMD